MLECLFWAYALPHPQTYLCYQLCMFRDLEMLLSTFLPSLLEFFCYLSEDLFAVCREDICEWATERPAFLIKPWKDKTTESELQPISTVPLSGFETGSSWCESITMRTLPNSGDTIWSYFYDEILSSKDEKELIYGILIIDNSSERSTECHKIHVRVELLLQWYFSKKVEAKNPFFSLF